MLHEINLGIGVTVRYLEAETDPLLDEAKSILDQKKHHFSPS